MILIKIVYIKYVQQGTYHSKEYVTIGKIPENKLTTWTLGEWTNLIKTDTEKLKRGH